MRNVLHSAWALATAACLLLSPALTRGDTIPLSVRPSVRTDADEITVVMPLATLDCERVQSLNVVIDDQSILIELSWEIVPPCNPWEGRILWDLSVNLGRLAAGEYTLALRSGSDTGGGSFLVLESGAFLRGDTNADGAVDIADPITTLQVLFLGAGEILCEDAADSNDDGSVDVSDAINSLMFLFTGHGDIPAPGPSSCGLDKTPGDNTCDSFPPCEDPADLQ